MSSLAKNIFYNGSREKYSEFISSIKEAQDVISKSNFIEFDNNIKDSFDLTKQKDNILFYEYLFFINYSKLLNMNINSSFHKYDILNNQLNKLPIHYDKDYYIKDAFRLFMHIHFYSLIRLEKIIFYLCKNSDNKLHLYNKIKEINELKYILLQVLILILKLYKERIYTLKHLLIFLDTIALFINKNSIIDDKYINVKNMLLFEIFFGQYLVNISLLVLNDQPEDKVNICLFFDYLIHYLKRSELKQHFNLKILSNNKDFHKFIEVLLYNFDYKKNIVIYKKYKDEIIDCLTNIYENNINQNNFFDILINQNKKSFINLFNYATKKEQITKDLYINNFYIELLQKIFYIEKKIFNPKNHILDILPPNNSFIFNGFNSKLVFQLNKFSLENSILFFSFQLNNNIIPSNKSYSLPLIIFEALLPTESTFKIIIKRDNNINRLMILQEKKNEKKSKLLNLDKIENIKPNINYYLAISFKEKQTTIQVTKLDIKTEKNYIQEIEILPFKFVSATMKVGHDDKTNEYYKGYIGSIIIIKNFIVQKNADLDSIITSVLALKNNYKLLPYFFNNSADINIDSYFYYSHYKEENKDKAIIDFIKNNIEGFKCSLYITPEIMDVFNSFQLKNMVTLFPQIPLITDPDNCYIINDLNISLTKINYAYIEFQKNNGFDLFSLVFEYFYQFLSLMKLKEKEFNINLNKDILEDIIINSLNLAFKILSNYNDNKIISNNLKSFKTLYRNIFETLKQLKKGSFRLIQNISKEAYELFLGFKSQQIESEKELELKKNEDVSNEQNQLRSFIDGLIDMIYDKELYINYENDEYINLLFMLTRTFMMNYLDEKKPKKIPFKPEFLYKILKFINILEKEFTNDYMKKSKTLDSFYNLLKYFFKTLIKENNYLTYFRQLIPFSIINYENNLIISYRFLKFINELLWEKYTLESEDIHLLLNYKIKLREKIVEEKNKNLVEEINSIIVCIIIKTSFFNKLDDMINDLNLKLEEYINNEMILSSVIFELKKIFEKLIKVGIEEFRPMTQSSKNINNDNSINYMDLFWEIFNFIINLFKLIIKKYENVSYKGEEEDEEPEDDLLNISYQELFSLLDYIAELLKGEFKQNNFSKYKIFCVINYIKFYHYIVFNEIKIFQDSNKRNFIDNLLKAIQLSSESFILNCSQLIKIKIGNNEYSKTLVEIIFELYVKYIFNSNDSIECFKSLLLKFNDIFYDKEFKSEGKCSFFFANDYLKYLLSQKKIKEKTESILNKYKIVLFYNKNVFKNEEKFELNFTTYFIELIIESENKIKNAQNLNKNLVSRLINFMNQLFVDILQEHKNLYNIDKKYFFKISSSPSYTEKINYIRDKYIKKNIPQEEIKDYFNNIIQNKSSLKENEETNISDGNQINSFETKEQLFLDDSSAKNIPFEFPKTTNEIRFFEKFDENYVYNQKKDLMNNIFAIYYIDELFYNEDFCAIKKYYNNYVNQHPYNNSKQLKFPSTIKNYRNNLENSIFIKQYNNYFTDPYLPITHKYIKDDLEKKLSRKKSIKLIKKDFSLSSDNDKTIECELLKNENYYYGHLIYNYSEKYFLFKEEFREYKDEEAYKYIFLLHYYWNNEYKNKEKTKQFRKKEFEKIVLILFDDIEEIVEMRILLLWKAFEIYVKNGKSYLFNFLNTNEYENFMKDFLTKSKLKHLIRKRDFLTEKSNIYKDWKAGLISNQDYLLLLNRYSSRSFNDPTQYPVFPWLLYDYKTLETFNENENVYLNSLKEFLQIKDDNEEILSIQRNKSLSLTNQKFCEIKDLINNQNYDIVKKIITDKNERKKLNYDQYYSILKDIITNIKRQLRDFLYAISLQTKEKREKAKIKYEEDKEDNVSFPIHLGCHYSNSAYIYFYLMRQQPYGNLLVRLQEYTLENVNRCFSSILNFQFIKNTGNENRELIPEFFSKIEYFLNLNCDFYGIMDIKNINLDDCELDIFENKNSTYLPLYVNFILKHKKLLNSKIIGYYLNQWIDSIFGINQLPPEKLRLDSCNIFSKNSYEQIVNLEKKLEKKKKKENITQKEIIDKMFLLESQLLNFGVAPSQLFHIPHGVLNISTKNDINKQTENKEEVETFGNYDEENNDDIESIIIQNIRSEKLSCIIKQKGEPLYFMINPSINKIFIYNERDNITIYDCHLFNEMNSNYFAISDLNIMIDNPNIFYTTDNPIYQIKYGLSSFTNEINYNLYDSNDEKQLKYHTYHNIKINYLLNKNNFKNVKNEREDFKIITSKHIDFTFQIHYFKFITKKNKKRETYRKIFSFFCEDFICSCCCLSKNTFILGLKNGKLIHYQINLFNLDKPEKQEKNKLPLNEKIIIKKIKYIQEHHGKINTIEVDKKLGIIITSGDDNYIIIRKLYDFEMLLPIKIKQKYRILMTKISPYNFFYILCFNVINQKKIIVGYTFSGIKFARSKYGTYTNINVTEDGNILTIDNEKNIIILSGSDLTKLYIYEGDLKEIKCTNWIQYDCFMRKEEENMSKILTYFTEQKDGFYIKTLSLSEK